MCVLETKALTRRFGENVAVDALTISVEAGEVFGLLGPNGAGKTTTIKMLTTLLPLTSGNACVAGFDIAHHAADVRRVIGYVPQMVSADGSLSGYENLLIFAKLFDIPRSERESRICDALTLMGLTDAAQKLVRQYSGGMVRRQSAKGVRFKMFKPSPFSCGIHLSPSPCAALGGFGVLSRPPDAFTV
ncbi:MAG TPA: ATP-binding cassette domain-containing protein, partial [Syntrophobacteria bacterium]|nr:ATP-binding cassette domain-containing protein [Syntrophobacteria bacterium]